MNNVSSLAISGMDTGSGGVRECMHSSIFIPSYSRVLRTFLSVAEKCIRAKQPDPLQTRVSGLEAKETICFLAHFPEELSDTYCILGSCLAPGQHK